MKEYIKSGFILLIFCLIAGFALGLVYTVTKDRIAITELGKEFEAIEAVLKDESGKYIVPLENIRAVVAQVKEETKQIFDDGKGKVYSPVYEFNSDLGPVYVLSGSAIGYGGSVSVVASFVKKTEGFMLFSIRVTGYSQETPGLGAKIGEEEVQKRFYPIEPLALQNGIQVDKDVKMSDLSVDEAKAKGIVKVSDVMTGATITPRAVTNAINAMLSYLRSGVK